MGFILMKKILKLNGVDIEIDSSGTNFKNIKTNHVYSENCNSSGYLYIAVFNKGKRKNYLIHRLVAMAFIPNPNNKDQVNHIDEITTHNEVSNLEWSTSYENSHYGSHIENVKIGLQKSVGKKCKITLHKNKDIEIYFDSIRDASKYLGMSNGSLIGSINKYNGEYLIKRKNITISLI